MKTVTKTGRVRGYRFDYFLSLHDPHYHILDSENSIAKSKRHDYKEAIKNNGRIDPFVLLLSAGSVGFLKEQNKKGGSNGSD